MEISWSIEFVNAVAEKEIKKLSPDLQVRFIHLAELLIEFGPQSIGMPHTRVIEGKIWEMRLRGKDNIARSFYYLANERRIIILHTFVKKTQKAPKSAIDIAKRRLKEIDL